MNYIEDTADVVNVVVAAAADNMWVVAGDRRV